mgnify:FL=1
MNIVFTKNGWNDYQYWLNEDKKNLKRLNKLIQDNTRNKNTGIGKPKALTNDLQGLWSRRINERDRLIYKIESNELDILSCRYYYGDH